MKPNDFINLIEKYYGKFNNDSRRGLIREYLMQNWTEQDLDKLYELTLSEFSSQYKTQPDIAVFERIKRDYNNANGEMYRFAGGKVSFLGQGIGIEKPDDRQIESDFKQLPEET